MAFTGVASSKVNTYAVTDAQTGVNTSKVLAYAVIVPAPFTAGVAASKENVYANITPAPGVDTSKAVAYAIIIGYSLTVSCNNPPAGYIGEAYSQTFTASGGFAPYTFAVISGALPPVLILNSTTGTASGAPTTSGTYTFMILATDAQGNQGTVICSIVISRCPPVDNSTTFYTTPAVMDMVYVDGALLHAAAAHIVHAIHPFVVASWHHIARLLSK